MNKQLIESVNFVKENISDIPRIAIILGSGLGTFADHLSNRIVISCKDIPHYPVSTVEGHAGLLYFGNLNDARVLALKGRVHSYEGYSLDKVTYPVRIMAQLGIESLIVTNAAGGINRMFEPGDLMLITDHINLMFDNPLIRIPHSEEESRFVDMSETYHPTYLVLAEQTADDLNIQLKRGTLVATKGPTYETAAEIRMLRTIGADAGTMSTIPEVIVAHQHGIKIIGISCITNMATGITGRKLDHHEVTVTADKIKEKFIALISEIIRRITKSDNQTF
ncbi:purine-nucleoside phosphorylase [candidate division KSB1 bacterium]|nr:purine-nucleoside phosphorylase [candidate division KSB1 bacterium]